MEHVSYQIDRNDQIVAVGDDWVAFAEANDAAHLVDDVVGRSLWEFVSDPMTRHVYRALLARVRAAHTVSFDYRCDAPALRRYMRMTMTPRADGGVTFDSLTQRTEARTPLLRDWSSPKGAVPGLRMCGWCKRVEVSDSWDDLETAVERLGLFALSQSPLITHAMCPSCYVRFMEQMDAA